MYRNLTITGFRGFKHFTMSGLGRVNLLVGTNNSGKTSLLEAITILAHKAHPLVLMIALELRGEQSPSEQSDENHAVIEVAHLFYSHEIKTGSEFSIAGLNDLVQERITTRVLAQPPADQAMPKPGLSRMRRSVKWLQLQFEGGNPYEDGMLLTHQGSWILEDMQRTISQFKEEPWDLDAPLEFITTRFLNNKEMISNLSKVLLNPEQEQVIDALRIIEPRLEGITPVPVYSDISNSDKIGIFVKLRGVERRVPIGSLGDGVWRLLGIALSLVSSKNGVLLVDDIDTGLHYTVMADMWKMVHQTAKRLNVQVFATTHSRDCVEALASIARPEVTEGSEVSIQRIQPDRAIAYSESEIVAAAARGIEVR